jgi:nitrogen fixation NifU-like protein
VFLSGYNQSVYSAQVLDHFEKPRFPGEVANPDASVQLENPACGDILKLTLKVTDYQITEARFMAKGCVPAMAMGSLLTGLLAGRSVREAAQLSTRDLIAAIGGLPPASTHASYLAIEALTAALKQLRDQEPTLTASGQ